MHWYSQNVSSGELWLERRVQYNTVSWRADWCQVKVLYCRFILNLVQHRLYVLCRVIIIFCQHNLVVLLLYDDNIQVPGVSPASIWCPFNQWLLCWLMADDARCYGRNFTNVCYSLPSLYITMLQVSLILLVTKETGTCMVSGCDIDHCIGLFFRNKLTSFQ